MSESDRDFTRDVSQYDAWYRTPWGSHAESEETRLLLEMARPQVGERALDVGCGTGRMLVRLLSAGVDAHGVEPARDMRAAAQGRLERLGYDTGRIVDGRAEALPFDANSFDLVSAITVLEFVEDAARGLREMARVCRGRLFVIALNARSLYGARILRGGAGETLSRAALHTPEELAALVRDCVGPERMAMRTALIGAHTDDPLELAVQREMDRRLRTRRSALGGVIALAAEVQS
jgi:ubiquinone/menaquinone biosynthesis C-methylase UbiE